jgi:hypothetical protein
LLREALRGLNFFLNWLERRLLYGTRAGVKNMFIGKQLSPRRLRLLDLCPKGRSSIGRALFIREGKVIHLGTIFNSYRDPESFEKKYIDIYPLL